MEMIMAMILLAASAGLAILSGARNAEALGKAGLRIDAEILLDRSAVEPQGSYNGIPLTPDYSKFPNITLAQYTEFAKNPNVDGLKMYVKSGITGGEAFRPVDLVQKPNEPEHPEADPDDGSVSFVNPVPDYTIYGYSGLDMISDLANGTMKITAGAIFNPAAADYRCVILRELAEQNGIAVGETVRLTTPYNAEEGYDFTICGIYTTAASGEGPGETSASLNTIYTSYLRAA